MIIAIDFDRTLVADGPYDATTPLRLLPGAKEALMSLRAAGHQLVLWSARSSPALLKDPMLDPLVRAGAKRANLRLWELQRPVHQARYDQMVAFVEAELPRLFNAVDDGAAGKFEFDLVIDDKAIRFGDKRLSGMSWPDIATRYGAPVYEPLETAQ